MLGKRSDQRGLWEADHLYLDLVGRDSFYGRLAGLRGQLFRDEDFAALYGRDKGRNSIPPSLLVTALLLQAHDRVSDAEGHHRATVDLSWKVALGVEVRPLAQSTLQHFRAQLVLHAQIRDLFLRSLELALDTTPILRRGAVKDTYNLRADGIRPLLRTLAREAFLAEIMADADRLLAQARDVQAACAAPARTGAGSGRPPNSWAPCCIKM